MKRPPHLSGSQRRQLKALAHPMKPIVLVGKDGVDDSLLDAVNQALDDHELIKVKVLQNAPLTRAAAAEQMAEGLGAHLVGEVGRVVMLYRRHPENPVVPLKT